MEKHIQIREDNPLFAKPQTEAHPIPSPDTFFSDVPTSADFMEEQGKRYAEKQTKLANFDRERSLLDSSLSTTPSTPNQAKFERSLIESEATPEQIEEYLAYKNASRETILEPTKTLSAFLDLPPEDVPVLEDFLLMAHRNNVGYAFTVPKSDWRSSSFYHLSPPA